MTSSIVKSLQTIINLLTDLCIMRCGKINNNLINIKKMKNITEFLKECRVNGNEKIDTNDDSFWKLKDLLEHYKEQCNMHVVIQMLLCNFTEKEWGITKGKKYKLNGEDKHHYYFINDKGIEDRVFKQYFEKIPAQ